MCQQRTRQTQGKYCNCTWFSEMVHGFFLKLLQKENILLSVGTHFAKGKYWQLKVQKTAIKMCE